MTAAGFGNIMLQTDVARSDEREAITVERWTMQPAFIEKERMILAGFGFFGDPFATQGGWTEENEIGRLWQRLLAFLTARCPEWMGREPMYEVHIQHPETARIGHFEVFAGLEVAQVADVPVELLVKVLPPATYAVFTFAGQQIVSDWPRLIQEWLASTGRHAVHGYEFQLYDRRFKGMDRIDESVIDVYVPVA